VCWGQWALSLFKNLSFFFFFFDLLSNGHFANYARHVIIQLRDLWKLFTKVKDNVENGRRLENLSWR